MILTRQHLRPYQRYLADRIVNESIGFLAVDMGLGKTASTLAAVRELLDEFAIRHVLIIAPLLVAETTWPDEMEKWDFARPLTYEVLTGNVEVRSYRARVSADIHIINRENIPWLVEFWGPDWPYDMLVVDESQSFKNPSKTNDPTKKVLDAVRARVERETPKGPDYELDVAIAMKREVKKLPKNYTRFGALCTIRKYLDRVVLLTGTPSPQGLEDLWSQTYLLDQGERLGRNVTAFRERWFWYDKAKYRSVPRDGAQAQITSAISDIMISMRSDDYVQLPEIVFNDIEAPLPPKAMAEYKRFERTLVSEMYDVTAASQGVLANKLLQFANGSMYVEDGEDVEIHDAKLKALERIVEECNGEPILVLYSFKFDQRKILKKFPQAVAMGEDSSVVRRWNDRKIPILVGHPASMGHGLNLQQGGHIAVWYGFSYTLEHYLQANKRLHRPGQKNTVIIHRIVAPGTLDSSVLEALARKEATQDDVLDSVRLRLEIDA